MHVTEEAGGITPEPSSQISPPITYRHRGSSQSFSGGPLPHLPKEAVTIAKERSQPSAVGILPKIPTGKLGLVDEQGRVTRLPIFGGWGGRKQDLTYLSDARQDFHRKSYPLPYGPLRPLETELSVETHVPPTKSQWTHSGRLLEVKLPYAATHSVQSYQQGALQEEVSNFFASQEGQPLQSVFGVARDNMTLEMSLQDRPSGRRQAQLLAAWLKEYLQGLASADSPQPPSTAAGTTKLPPLGMPAQSFALPGLDPPTQPGDETLAAIAHELADHKVKHEKALSSLTNLQAHGLLGVTRDDPGTWSTLIQALGVCSAFLAQQVGIHCHERGALLCQVWNLYTELMDMKFADMREAVLTCETLRQQNTELKVQMSEHRGAHSAYLEGSEKVTQELQAQVKDLNSRVQGATIERDSITRDNTKLEDEIARLHDLIQDIQNEMIEKDSEISRLEHECDIMTTTLSGMEDGHHAMKDIIPGIQKNMDDTMRAVDKMVKKTKTVSFGGNFNEVVQDTEYSMAQMQINSSELESQIHRLIAMGELAEKQLEGIEEEDDPEALLQEMMDQQAAEADEKRRSITGVTDDDSDDYDHGPFRIDVECQTPQEWMNDDNASDSSSEFVEEAEYCNDCGAKMDTCSKCLTPPAPVIVKEIEYVKDTDAEQRMEEEVRAMRNASNSLRQEINKWQKYAEKAEAALRASGAADSIPKPPTPDGDKPLPSALVHEPGKQDKPDKHKKMGRVTTMDAGTEPIVIEGSTPKEQSEINKLQGEVARLQMELKEAQLSLKSKIAQVKARVKGKLDTLLTRKQSAAGKGKSATLTVPDNPASQEPKRSKLSRSKTTGAIAEPKSLQAKAPEAPESSDHSPAKATAPQKASKGQSQSQLHHEESSQAGQKKAGDGAQNVSKKALVPFPAPAAKESNTTVANSSTAAPDPRYKNQNLREALQKYGNAKPRTAEWLLAFTEKIYKGKYQQDITRAREGQPLSTFIEYLFQHLQGTYGTRMLVLEYVGQIISTLRKYSSKDSRFKVFDTFLREDWDATTLEVFLHARAMLQEAAPVKCLVYPKDYAPIRGGSPWICTRKAMSLADLLLMERSPAAMHGLHDVVLSRAVEAEPEEKHKFFPVAENQSHMVDQLIADEERNGGPFHKVQSIMFLEELCHEFHRCETCLSDAAPEIFKKYDYNSNGLLEYKELRDILKQLQQECGEEFMEANARDMWARAVDIQIQGEVAKGGPQRDPQEVHHIGSTAWKQAALFTPVIRRYVRLFMTPPPRVDKEDNQVASTSKMLAMVISRHWKLYGHRIEAMVEHTGANNLTLLSMIRTLKKENDGMEKCSLYSKILKVMCDSKLEDLQMQCAAEHLKSGYDDTLEENLQKMATALKVFYGSKCLMEDDFPQTPFHSNIDSRSSLERLEFYNAVKFKANNYAVLLIQNKYRARGQVKAKLGNILMASTDVKRLQSEGSKLQHSLGPYLEMEMADRPADMSPEPAEELQVLLPANPNYTPRDDAADAAD